MKSTQVFAAMDTRPMFSDLVARLKEPRRFIQFLLGPRQVGKTTLALQAAKALGTPSHYASADLATLQDLAWLRQQWEVARALTQNHPAALLIIDEVQKIPNWSDMVKSLWDEDTRHQTSLMVMILGSSPWMMQRGLSESLAGRFEVLPVTHWSFAEMQKSFGCSINQYLYFGGYPGAAPLINEADPVRWQNYINDSLIETTLSRDILLGTQVNRPALLRRLFQLGCNYSGQILSYTKMLGALHDSGNTTTLAHYLHLLSEAGLLAGLQKFAGQSVRQRGSSPKLQVFNTALMSAQSPWNYHQAKLDSVFWGRLVESSVGAYLLNSIRGSQVELFYWREGSMEVDFVLKCGHSITAIEVKSGRTSGRTGIDAFCRQFHPSRVLLVGDQGIPLSEFLQMPVTEMCSA